MLSLEVRAAPYLISSLLALFVLATALVRVEAAR
jgi:hypothetical protein